MNELNKKKLLSNSIFSGSSFFISILVRLTTMPYVFNHLNINEYGILALITNILAYFSFFDLGVGRSIIKFLSENNRKNDIDQFNKYLSTGILFYLFVGCLSALLLWINASTIVITFFEIPTEFHKVAISCLIISGFNFLIVIQNQLLVSIPEAFNRFDISKFFQIITNVISSIITLLIVYLGYGLTEIVYFNVLFGILTLYVNYQILKQLVPKVKFIFKIDLSILKKMLKFGLVVMLGNIVFTGYTLFDLTFIGSIIGASALAYYSVSSTASRYLHGVVGSILLPIFPLASEHSVSNKNNFENIYYKANKFSIILSVYLCLILCLLSKDILNIWMGESFTKNAQLSFVLLVLSWAIFSFTIVSFQTSEGFGFPKFNLIFALCCTISSVLFYKILIPKFGIDGAAMSRLISIIIIAPLYVGYVERKIFNSNKIKFWAKNLLIITISSLIIYLPINYAQTFYKPTLLRLVFSIIFISVSYPTLLFYLGIFDTSEKFQIKNFIIKLSTIKQKKMKTIKKVFLRTLTFFWVDLKIGEWISKDVNTGKMTLDGDRAIEFPWCIRNFNSNNKLRILDVGCVQSPLTGMAWRLGHDIVSVDLREIEYEMPRVDFIKKDVTTLDFSDNPFDLIIFCSTIEHVGLLGRYSSNDKEDGDIRAINLCKNWLKKDGKIILTIPVGQDAIIRPYHRIYGEKTLPNLINNYNILDQEFWAKRDDNKWIKVDKEHALMVDATKGPYALGLFDLVNK